MNNDILKQINKHFLIRTWHNSEPNNTKLMSAKAYLTEHGFDRSLAHFLRALNSKSGTTTFCFRTGVRSKFISK